MMRTTVSTLASLSRSVSRSLALGSLALGSLALGSLALATTGCTDDAAGEQTWTFEMQRSSGSPQVCSGAPAGGFELHFKRDAAGHVLYSYTTDQADEFATLTFRFNADDTQLEGVRNVDGNMEDWFIQVGPVRDEMVGAAARKVSRDGTTVCEETYVVKATVR